jgi:AcrR family transcriptional regulator
MGRGKDAEIRKQEIIEQFYQVISENGLENSSIAKIAKRLSVSPSLLIHHFKTKENMVVSLFDYIVQKFTETFISQIDSEDDPRKRLETTIELIFSNEWSNAMDERVYISCLQLSFQNENLRERLRIMYDNLINFVINQIRDYGIHYNVKTIEIDKAARLIVALQDGLDFFKVLYPDDHHFPEMGAYVKAVIFKSLDIDLKAH